jgi:hypothetical protein
MRPGGSPASAVASAVRIDAVTSGARSYVSRMIAMVVPRNWRQLGS